MTWVFATAAMGFADNVTPGTARNISMNSTAQDFLESGSRTSVWYKVQLFASRSYQISVWTVREDGVFVNIDPVELYSDAAGTVLVSSGVTTTDSSFEGSPNDSNLGSRTTIFQPTATGVYLIHAGTDTVALAPTKVNIRVRETTLFSPWTSRAAGFEGFMEIHNNTSAAVSVTLRAFNNAGTLQGAALTFAVPANATEFKTATQVGVPVGTFAGLVLTHDGAFGAISGNITTLNGANGLSFDSAFTPREFAGGDGGDSSATSGANSDITSLTGLTTPLSVGQGGTGQTTAVAALTSLGGASSGANSDITSLTGLTTPLAVGQGGTGRNTLATNGVVYGQGTAAVATAVGAAGQVLAGTAGAPVWTGSPSLSGSITLPSPSTATTGNIMKGANRFVHNFGTSNTFIGENAGNFSMTGSDNTGSGASSLLSNTTGNSNTATGRFALQSNTTGSGNTASAHYALLRNTSGNSNTGTGYAALYSNTTGNFNTASGVDALSFNTTASKNTAIGVSALRDQSFTNANTPWDSFNTAVGYQALFSNQPTTTTTGINNTAIGANALFTSTTGNSNTATGVSALQSNTTGTGNTANAQSALLSNTAGNFNTATGLSALQGNTTGSSNTGSGVSALLSNTTGNSNTASGVDSLLSNTAASKNTAIGLGALRTQSFSNANTPWDSFNTAVGYQALFSNQPTTTTTGINNTAIGANALFTNTTGNSNAATGVSALGSNTTGTGNTAHAQSALLSNTTGNFNTATGLSALQSNTTGSGNTGSGQSALQTNTTGSSNTATGANALSNNTSGANNTAIGFGANVSTGALTNATAIGSGATVDASNKIRLGNAGVTVIEGQVAYTFTSDRTRKENFRNVDDQRVLEKLRELSVTTWNYVGHDPKEFRHYGPMAQDFFAAFGRDEVGAIGTETTINSGDITAILMIGLKGLDQQVQKDQRTIEVQAAEIASLKLQTARIADLEGSRQALAAELVSLKAQVWRVADLLQTLAPESASRVNAPATKGADPIGR